MNDLEANIAVVEQKIKKAADRVSRDPEEIKVVAITKTHSPDTVRRAYDLGLRNFGENRVFEGLEKISELHDLTGARWHMVGHIQSRKASVVPANFDVVHSLDRMKIARHLDKHAGQAGIKLPVLLECNVSGEGSKYGWEMSDRDRWNQILPDVNKLFEMENLNIRGLMTMAPWVEDENVIRSTFVGLRSLRDFIQDELGVILPELSIGMTDDYEIAIEEGATMLRIGRAIFGPRQT